MHIGRVALRVSDPARSADFYAGVARLEVQENDGERATLGPRGGGDTLLELRRAQRPGQAPRRAAGLFHTAFLYPTRAQLGAVLAGVAEQRVPITGASDHLVSEAVYLDDPDGLGIELYRDRPRSEWPEPDTPREKVRMATLPMDVEGVLGEAGDAPEEPGTGVRVGHVHLKVADVDEATRFWTETIGMELMTTYPDAAFLADEGYHHHVGANMWMSRGAPLEPAEGPGLDEVVVAGAPEPREERTPDGVRVVLEA